MSDRPQVSIEVRSEKVTVGVRGVFLIRAADGDPHQVRMEDVRLAPVGHPGRSISVNLDPLLLDVQPAQDLVVPFDVRATEAPRGAYAVEATVMVDGSPWRESIEGEFRVR